MREQALLAILSGEDTRATACAARSLLSCLAPVYSFGADAKNLAFAKGWRRAHALGRPTVSVGNLTTGGTGKTPMVAWVARQLAAVGHRPCILLRGYRGKGGTSDETEELRLAVGDMAHVAPHPDRVAEARRVLAAHPEVTCFILDDGFQHRRAGRDLDLLLVDATNPWGYGRTLPRGLLRESRKHARRADAVVVTRSDRVTSVALARLAEEIRALTGHPPLALARHGWEGFRVFHDGADRVAGLDALIQERVAVTCGIGNPAAFMAEARAFCGTVVTARAQADHFAWDAPALAAFFAEARTEGAGALLTTEKDFVKWRPQLAATGRGPGDPPVFRPRLSMQFSHGGEALATLLASRIPSPIPASA